MRSGGLIPLGFLAGAALGSLLLQHAPHRIAADLAQPLAVVTYWKGFGALLFAALLGALAIAGAGYALVLRALTVRPPAHAARGIACICAISAAACAAALAFPVVFSSDVYAYAGYGYLALHGANPYGHAAITLHAPLFRAVTWQWGNPPPACVYGPLFVWIAKELVAVTLPLGIGAPLWALRAAACLALVSCAPLAYAAFAGFPQSVRFAAAAGIALNPVAVWSSAEGHNDAIALAIVLGGFAVARLATVPAGAAIVALGALVKAPALGAAAGMLLAAWRERPRFMSVLSGIAIGCASTAIVALPLVQSALAHLGHSAYDAQFSPQALLATILPLWAAAAFVFVAAAALGTFGVRKLLVHDLTGAVWIALAAWYALPNPYPWYGAWIAPLAFLRWPSRTSYAILGATLCIALRYLPDAVSPHANAAVATAIVLGEYGVPALFLIAYTPRLARRGHPAIRMPAPGFAEPRLP